MENGSIRYRSEAGWPKEESGGGWKISHNRCFRAREKEAKEFSNFFCGASEECGGGKA